MAYARTHACAQCTTEAHTYAPAEFRERVGELPGVLSTMYDLLHDVVRAGYGLPCGRVFL